MAKAVARAPEIEFCLHVFGAPCQDVTGLSGNRKGVSGSRSSLLHETPRIRGILRRTLGKHCQLQEVCENVASMSESDQATYDKVMNCKPLRICPKHLGWVRRPRLFWVRSNPRAGTGVVMIPGKRYIDVQLKARRMPLSRWLPRGWKLAKRDTIFPIFVRGAASASRRFYPQA